MLNFVVGRVELRVEAVVDAITTVKVMWVFRFLVEVFLVNLILFTGDCAIGVLEFDFGGIGSGGNRMEVSS